MGFAEEMGNLGENFITSFDNRIKDVGKILGDSHKLMKNIHKENEGLFDQTHDYLKSCRREHQGMSCEDRKERRNFVKNLQDHEKRDRRERQKFHQGICDFCGELANETHKHMKHLRKEFDQGHRNFQRAMNEIQRHRKAVKFPTMSTRGSEERYTTTTSSPKKRKKTKQGKKRRRVH